MNDLKNLALAAFVLGALVSGIGAWKYQENRWTATMAVQKKDAAELLTAETEKVRQAENKYDQFKTQVEKIDGTRKAEVESVLRDNRRLARELGGLRDPGRRPSGSGTAPNAAGAAGQCPAGSSEGRLSDEASEFLLELAAEADRAAIYAQTCHDWAMSVKKFMVP